MSCIKINYGKPNIFYRIKVSTGKWHWVRDWTENNKSFSCAVCDKSGSRTGVVLCGLIQGDLLRKENALHNLTFDSLERV